MTGFHAPRRGRGKAGRVNYARGSAVLVLAAALLGAPMIGVESATAGTAEVPVPGGLGLLPELGSDLLAPLVLGPPIKDHWIVTFDASATAEQVEDARETAGALGGIVGFEYGTAITGFSARLEEDALRTLRENPHVLAVEPDYEVQADDTQSTPPWGLDRLDQTNLPLSKSYTYGPTGRGVTAYVLDTGVRTTHAEFGGRAREGFSAFNDGRGAQDCNGHGTHVAGTIGGSRHGVAKDVEIVSVRVLDCQGGGTTSGVIAGVDWVTANAQGPSVANMSLGSAASTALDNAVSRSITAGIAYAVAAGNENQDACGKSPARLSAALTVGASTETDARAGFSNYGACVDLFAPGDRIASAAYTSDTGTALYSGTSMASPHVAGVVAAYLEEHPTATPAQIGTAVSGGGVVNTLTGIGAGSPNRLLSTLNLAAPVPGTAPAPAPPRPPVATAPTAKIAPGTRVASTKVQVPLRVTWSARTSTGATVARYQLQRSRDGGRTWKTMTLSRATSTRKTVSLGLGSHRFRVRATDTLGQVGTWATGRTFTLRVKKQSAVIHRPAGR